MQVSIEAFEDQLTLCLYRRPFENEPILRYLAATDLCQNSETKTQGQVSSNEHHRVPGSTIDSSLTQP